jgi:phosphoglycerol transferase MdoB-like AlkP superfamily enzyme
MPKGQQSVLHNELLFLILSGVIVLITSLEWVRGSTKTYTGSFIYAFEFGMLPLLFSTASFYVTDLIRNRLLARASFVFLFLLIMGFSFTTRPAMLE